MKIILQQDVKKLGKKGDVLEVAEGYARNYLFPRKLAVEATQGQLKERDLRSAAESRRQQQVQEEAQELANRLEELVVKMTTKTGDGGRLFGSITSKDIAEALSRQHQIDLDKKKLELKENIKALGVYPVTAKLHPKVQTTFKVQVVEE